MVAENVKAADKECEVTDIDCDVEDLLERNRRYSQPPFKKLMAANRATLRP